MRLLLDTAVGTEKTLDFLKKTSVGTRKWHLNRVEREEALDARD